MTPHSNSEPGHDRPAVYALHRQQNDWRFTRRGFLAAAGLASAALLAHLGRHPEAQALGVEALPEPSDAVLLALVPGQRFAKTWQLRNNGTQPWGDDAELRLTDPAGLRAPASYRLPNLQPGESVALRVELIAPEAPGVSQSQWRVAANGVLSRTLYLPIMVQGPEPTATLTPWPSSSCIVESPHPYSGFNRWYITNPDPNAWGTKLHLSRLELAGEDSLRFHRDDSAFYSYELRSHHNGADIWTDTIESRVVRVVLSILSGSGSSWGFCIDDIASALGPTATHTPTPCAGHCHCNTIRTWPCYCVTTCPWTCDDD